MTRIHLTLAALVAFGGASFSSAAHAQTPPEKVTAGAPAAAPQTTAESRMQKRADHIEGHIAYLKAELMIHPGAGSGMGQGRR